MNYSIGEISIKAIHASPLGRLIMASFRKCSNPPTLMPITASNAAFLIFSVKEVMVILWFYFLIFLLPSEVTAQ